MSCRSYVLMATATLCAVVTLTGCSQLQALSSKLPFQRQAPPAKLTPIEQDFALYEKAVTENDVTAEVPMYTQQEFIELFGNPDQTEDKEQSGMTYTVLNYTINDCTYQYAFTKETLSGRDRLCGDQTKPSPQLHKDRPPGLTDSTPQ